MLSGNARLPSSRVVRLPEDGAEACLSAASLAMAKLMASVVYVDEAGRVSSAQRHPQGAGRRGPSENLGRSQLGE